MRVLIADDNEEIRSALRLVLQELEAQLSKAGRRGKTAASPITILEARNATDTLLLLENGRIDVILLDWELPGLDGAALVNTIAARPPHSRVIAMSGSPELRERALELGMGYFISKTDPPARLVQLLRDLMFQEAGDRPGN